MKPTLAVAVLGLLIAFVDIMGYAAVVETWVRHLMKWLWSLGAWTVERGMKVHSVLNWVTIGMVAILLPILAWDWMFGGASSTKETVRVWGGDLIVVVQLVLAAFAVGAAALWAVWGIFWILAWPRKGVVSSLGLVLAVAGVALEFG